MAASGSPRWWRKPAKGTAPSNYFINGRYILQPEIFDILALQERGAGNEIQVTDAMLKLAENQPFSAYRFGGETYDCGSKDGFILANVAYALARPDIKPLVAEGLKRLITGA
jgi:UTP--glucose-1-phosphate uridylyltransferase